MLIHYSRQRCRPRAVFVFVHTQKKGCGIEVSEYQSTRVLSGAGRQKKKKINKTHDQAQTLLLALGLRLQKRKEEWKTQV